MNDIIQQCARAICARLCPADMKACSACKAQATDCLAKFKELTAEPTDAMIYVGAYEVSDFLLEDEKAIACFKIMTEQMWKDIGI